MSLRTYRRTKYPALVPIDWTEDSPVPVLEPGIQVKTPNAGGLGLIVAMSDDEISVVWSQLPNTPYNESSYIEAGYVFAPYVPMQVTTTILTPEDFAPRKGIMSRYDKKLVRSDYYDTVDILNLTSGSK